ncbi:MAG: AbrB/MazE/SpoVT family DNA-binding domain-containing protein [Xanthomonadales bacterium]|nr:AbrB/MazE/SpoVT family DNA-binding domain-containing protein [Xanthomonadales bacterium]
MKIAKWGNSLAVRLPAAVVEALELKDGDDIEVRVGRDGLNVEKPEDIRALLARLHKYRGRMPGNFRFDRDEANSRER